MDKPEKTITVKPSNYMTPEEAAEELRPYLSLAECEWKNGKFEFVTDDGVAGFVETSGYAFRKNVDGSDSTAHDFDVDWCEVVRFSSAEWVDADDGSLILLLTL